MRKHHTEVFEGVLKPSIQEGTRIEVGVANDGTGIIRKTQTPTAKISGASSVTERADAYRDQLAARKKGFFSQISSPVPSPNRSGEFLIFVSCFWEEEDSKIPTAPSAMPHQASTVPRVRPAT